MHTLSRCAFACLLAIVGFAAQPHHAIAQEEICPDADCGNCHTHDEGPFTPTMHHFINNFGSCYKCEGEDGAGCHYDQDELGSCGSKHAICETDALVEVQHVLLAVWTGDFERVLSRLQSAKHVIVGKKLTTVVLAGCAGGAPQTIHLPAALVKRSFHQATQALNEHQAAAARPGRPWQPAIGIGPT